MSKDNELTVDREELRKAVGWISKGRKAEIEKTFLCFEEDGFTVVCPAVVTTIKSVGTWKTPVAVSAAVLKRCVSAQPRTKDCDLAFENGWLSVGKTRINAEVVGAQLLAEIFGDA